jgi:hypothetical protein
MSIVQIEWGLKEFLDMILNKWIIKQKHFLNL